MCYSKILICSNCQIYFPPFLYPLKTCNKCNKYLKIALIKVVYDLKPEDELEESISKNC